MSEPKDATATSIKLQHALIEQFLKVPELTIQLEKTDTDCYLHLEAGPVRSIRYKLPKTQFSREMLVTIACCLEGALQIARETKFQKDSQTISVQAAKQLGITGE